MAESEPRSLPPPNPEHRRIAAGQFERANQVIATGNYDYGIQLLLTCCKLDPANLIYRKALRQTEKAKFNNNMRGSRLALLTNSAGKAKMKSAKRAGEFLKVLEYGEEALTRNPWDNGIQMDMAEAADGLGLLDLAVWIMENARQKNPQDATVNRSLARYYEKRGNFTQAITLWEMVRQAEPKDVEAQNKGKDLAASDTIARGRYGAVVGEDSQADDKQKKEPPRAPGDARTGKPPSEERPFMPIGDRLMQEVTTLQARIARDPTSFNAYLQLAEAFRRANQFDQARSVLEQGLGPTGNHYELTIQLAELEIEPFRENLVIVDEKLRTQPQDEELRKMRIRLMKEINTRELDLYRQKADRYPTDKNFRFELGVRLLRAGQIDEAIRELQAVRTDPRYLWRALMYLGYCFKNRNNWRLAQRNFEEALTNVPISEESSRKEILFQLAQGCAEAGDLARAMDHGYDLANLDFAYRDIGKLLDEWNTRVSQADVSG